MSARPARGWLGALIAVQLVFLAVVAVATAFSFSRFTLDERAHFSYVEHVTDGQIPEVGVDLVSPQIAAIYESVYPGPPRVPPARQGLGGQSYEGFQPPLYYVVTAPVFAIAGDNYVHKLRALRLFNVLLLFGTAALLWLLARRVAGVDEDPLPLYALALTVLLWPGVVLRAVTVSNAALELLLGVALALAVWSVWERRELRRLVLLALLLGVALLTRVSLVAFAPSIAVVAVDLLRASSMTRARALGFGALLLAIPLAMVAPWLAFNVHVYGHLSGEAAIRRLQEPLLNPSGRQFGLHDLTEGVRRLTRAAVPDEWWVKFLSGTWRAVAYVLAVVLLAVTAIGLTRIGRERALRLATVGVLPVLATLVWMLYALLVSNWDFFLPRYLYPELVGFGLVAAVCVRRLFGARVVVGAAAGFSVALAALWIYLATSVTPFTG